MEDLLLFGKQFGATDVIVVGNSGMQRETGSATSYLIYDELAEVKRQVESAGLQLNSIKNQPFSW